MRITCPAVAVSYALALMMLFGGCSHTAAVAKKLGEVRTDAATSLALANEIAAEPPPNPIEAFPAWPKVVGKAKEIAKRQEGIVSASESASSHLTGTKDITPQWLNALYALAAIAAVAGLMFLGIYLWPLVRPWIVAIGALAPRPAPRDPKQVGAMVAKAMDPTSQVEKSELATFLLSDPAVLKEYRSEKGKRKTEVVK